MLLIGLFLLDLTIPCKFSMESCSFGKRRGHLAVVFLLELKREKLQLVKIYKNGKLNVVGQLRQRETKSAIDDKCVRD